MRNYQFERTCQIKDLASIYARHIGVIRDGFFVDVGAYDGVRYSNTSGLALAGWSGVMLEPNPTYYWACRENCKNYPEVTVLNCCAGNRDGVCKLYGGGRVKSTSAEMMKMYEKLQKRR